MKRGLAVLEKRVEELERVLACLVPDNRKEKDS
jgi:hypothetical protein